MCLESLMGTITRNTTEYRPSEVTTISCFLLLHLPDSETEEKLLMAKCHMCGFLVNDMKVSFFRGKSRFFGGEEFELNKRRKKNR